MIGFADNDMIKENQPHQFAGFLQMLGRVIVARRRLRVPGGMVVDKYYCGGGKAKRFFNDATDINGGLSGDSLCNLLFTQTLVLAIQENSDNALLALAGEGSSTNLSAQR